MKSSVAVPCSRGRHLLALACPTLVAVGSLAGPFGMSDPNFARPEIKQTVFPSYVRSDGRGGLLWSFVNGGELTGAFGQKVGGVVRTLESGVLDSAFATGPALRGSFGTAVQPDGKVLVGAFLAGDFNANGTPNCRVFRLLTNGTLDLSYSSPVFSAPPRFMALQPDGKLVVGGGMLGGFDNGGLHDTVRLNLDGSLDPGFSPAVIAGGSLTTIFAPPVFDEQGRILLGGNFTTVNGQPRADVFRLLSDGTLDPSFVPSGYTPATGSGTVRGIVVQNDGKIVIGGGRFRLPANPTNYVLLRLNTNGSLDTSFTLVSAEDAGFRNLNRIRLLRETADHKLLAVGYTVARFNADGGLDDSFNRPDFSGDYFDGECYWFELLSDGRILVPTSTPMYVNAAPVAGSFRLATNGLYDPTYNPPVLQSEVFPTGVMTQAGGGLVIWGPFAQVGATSRRGVARFSPNGTLDPAYDFNAFGDVQGVSVAAAAPDQSLYAILTRGADPVMNFSNSLVHITAAGQLDPGFQPTLAIPIPLNQPVGLFVQNAKPIVWWNTEQDLVSGRFPFYRLNSDGSVDYSFIGNTTNGLGLVQRDTNGFITNIIVGAGQLLAAMPSGKLIAAGTLDGVHYQLSRLNSDGTIDSTFNGPNLQGGSPTLGVAFIFDPQQGYEYAVDAVYAGSNPFKAAQPLADASVLVCGRFTQIGGHNAAGLARVQANGTVDPTFPGGAGATHSTNPARPARVDSVTVDKQGRIWITGSFDRFNDVPVKGIARLNPDGSVDPTVVSQATYYDYYYDVELAFRRGSSLVLNADGSVCPLGPYRLADDFWPYGLHRLIDYGPPTLTSPAYVPGSGFWFSANLVEGQPYRVQVSANLSNWDDLTNLTGSSSPLRVGDLSATNFLRRFYRVASP